MWYVMSYILSAEGDGYLRKGKGKEKNEIFLCESKGFFFYYNKIKKVENQGKDVTSKSMMHRKTGKLELKDEITSLTNHMSLRQSVEEIKLGKG